MINRNSIELNKSLFFVYRVPIFVLRGKMLELQRAIRWLKLNEFSSLMKFILILTRILCSLFPSERRIQKTPRFYG